jgi:hypothetical protein
MKFIRRLRGWRGDASRVAHGFPFDSIDTISFVTMMKREYFISGAWDYGSKLLQYLYVLY